MPSLDGSLAFTARLRDLLATLESSVLLANAGDRVRGLGAQLQFACAAMPCDEAFVALELEALGRLHVPATADTEGWRATEVQFLPSGTPFADLLGGGAGYGMQVDPDEPLLQPFRGAFRGRPHWAIFVPLRLGSALVGGVALLHSARLDANHLLMAERLADVLALTVSSFRTERTLLEVFALALPDLMAGETETSFPAALEGHIHTLRTDPAYRRWLELSRSVGQIATRGPQEAQLAASMLGSLDKYFRTVEGELPTSDPELG